MFVFVGVINYGYYLDVYKFVVLLKQYVIIWFGVKYIVDYVELVDGVFGEVI